MTDEYAVGDAVQSSGGSGYDRWDSILHQQFAYILGAKFERCVFHFFAGRIYEDKSTKLFIDVRKNN